MDASGLGRAADISARLDRLPGTRHVWRLVTLLSLGGCSSSTTCSSPPMSPRPVRSRASLTPTSRSLFGSPASPSSRRPSPGFSSAPLSSATSPTATAGAPSSPSRCSGTRVATLIMAFQTARFGVNLWRFIAGIGIGVELVTIDTYVAELVPQSDARPRLRLQSGRPVHRGAGGGVLAWQLVPHRPFGFDGWRWVVLIGSAGARRDLVHPPRPAGDRRAGSRSRAASRRPSA